MNKNLGRIQQTAGCHSRSIPMLQNHYENTKDVKNADLHSELSKDLPVAH